MKQFLLCILLLSFISCAEQVIPENQPSGFIQVKGSDTLVNAAQGLAEEFMKQYPYIYTAITGGGSGVGIASLINKTCDIATASREMKKKEYELAQKEGVFPEEFTVAYDGIAVIVHSNNSIKKLTLEQLRDIYTGKITSWKELGGNDLRIVALSREVNSGTYEYFKEAVIRMNDKTKKEEFAPKTLLLSSSQAIVEEVSQNEAAIGYLGMGYLSERTAALALQGKEKEFVLPDIQNVATRKYPLSRPLYIYTRKKPEGIIKLFIDFALSADGQEQFAKNGFVPLGNHGQKN